MIREAISILISGQSLTTDQAAQVMLEIMEGQATPAQLGAFLVALRLKGETVEEIVGLAKTMREKAIPVIIDMPVVDTCGTGGDSSHTFNISTAAAFVAAAAGAKVAKHGNRAMSSQCGSADVLEALGIRLDLTPFQVARCIEEVGIGFLFAPVFHPAMKYAAVPRHEIGIRTVFNILGPLTNPAKAKAQVLGVADKAIAEKMALALCKLGSHCALVVHGEDGLDEVTITGKTFVWEIRETKIRSYTITPEELGLSRASAEQLKGGTPKENAELLREIFRGKTGAQRDIVIANAAAALVAASKASTFLEGAALASKAIDNGEALTKLEHLIKFTQNLS
jgi:anthranilate phosphoribosyltransferase